MTVDVIHGDCRDVLPTLPACSFDAIVTDTPYHLTTGKKGGSGPASVNLDSPYGRARIGTGFMGMKWDGGDVAFRVETWQAALRVLKPGGHLLAFGGTRTYHRLVCAIEDAGFEIRDQIAWLFGSGFPKSLNLGGEWDGWGTALKPAHEPIVVARRPLIGTVAENVATHGCGALNIDGCRIQTQDDLNGGAYSGELRQRDEYTSTDGDGAVPLSRLNRGAGEYQQPPGRWPANVVHDGSDEVVERFPAEAGAAAPVYKRNGDKFRNAYGAFAGDVDEQGSTFHGDSGSAARFFYCAKASREDRDEGCDAFEKKPLLWSSGEQNPGSFQSPNTDRSARNFHPTVKPTALMRWLCRLVTPPGGKVLDFFAGSGSTGKACELEGFDCTLIEGEADYIPIINARLAFAREERRIATAQQSLFA